MANSTKTILIAGLSPPASFRAAETLYPDSPPPSRTLDIVGTQVEQAKARGFNCTVFIVKPQHPADTLAKLKAELLKQHWDGFSIGYGMRALKENSKLFENLVNLTVEVSPKTKF